MTEHIEGPLKFFRDMLEYRPHAREDDPRWKPWHIRPGDTVEVVVLRRHSGENEVIDTLPVVAADPHHLKLADGRVFTQAGWLMTRNKKSRFRVRKVKP